MDLGIQTRGRLSLSVVIFLLLIPLVQSDFFQRLGYLSFFIDFITATIFLFLVYFTVTKKQLNIFVITSLIFLIWRSVSSYYFSDGVMDLVNSTRIASLILLVNIFIKKYPKSTLSATDFLFSAYIVLNFFALLMFPQGLYVTDGYSSAWLFGIENQFALFIVPGITFIMLNSWYRYNTISIIAWLKILIAVITVGMIWSATAVVAVFFVIISSILVRQKRIQLVYTFFLFLLFYIIIWLIVVRFNSLDSFQAIITDILGKDLTLTGRTRIWAEIFETLPQSLWYGFGINSKVLAGVVTDFAAHNMILQLLLDSGIIGFMLFIIPFLIAGVKLHCNKEQMMSTLILIGLFAILIGGIAEAYKMNYLFLLMTFAYNINYIIDKNKFKND
ncbi:O-antigen ligase family protein [Gracilibacillus timonensis]|uniref:O-antigen ligase family protein n=1 Tax=Gracilibacillus timonensis TaxID=1816696 RepID=UPI000825BD2B|nr:O-antigen ligase family protein [Gracilibacillus timonensis]